MNVLKNYGYLVIDLGKDIQAEEIGADRYAKDVADTVRVVERLLK